MSDASENQIAAVTLNAEIANGEELLIAVPVRTPANAERVMDLVASIDDLLADVDPENQDAVMAAVILAMGNALRQAPDWPIKARLESFSRFVQGVVEDTIAYLPEDE
jgi:hypothetical protein